MTKRTKRINKDRELQMILAGVWLNGYLASKDNFHRDEFLVVQAAIVKVQNLFQSPKITISMKVRSASLDSSREFL